MLVAGCRWVLFPWFSAQWTPPCSRNTTTYQIRLDPQGSRHGSDATGPGLLGKLTVWHNLINQQQISQSTYEVLRRHPTPKHNIFALKIIIRAASVGQCVFNGRPLTTISIETMCFWEDGRVNTTRWPSAQRMTVYRYNYLKFITLRAVCSW